MENVFVSNSEPDLILHTSLHPDTMKHVGLDSFCGTIDVKCLIVIFVHDKMFLIYLGCVKVVYLESSLTDDSSDVCSCRFSFYGSSPMNSNTVF